MPAAARVDDPIGHAPGVSTGNLSGPGVTSVQIEGKAAAVLGASASCSKPKGMSTDGLQSFTNGSQTVLIGGANALRVNDSATPCGAMIIAGAQRVVIGG